MIASVTHAHTYIQTHTGTYTLTHAHTHSHMHIHAYTLTCLESLERSLGAWVMPLCHKVEELDYYIIHNGGLKTCRGHTTTMARAHIHTFLSALPSFRQDICTSPCEMYSTMSLGGIPLLVPVLAPVGIESSSKVPRNVHSWGERE